ncbi:MAG: Electron transfer flavoprotein subunit alpha [Alphaproteobacteria bacterium MarineAlpha9_Bin4]|nr:electron transfer flavoprotein subunit alpha [Pelagibacterales bacterium]MBF96705.1 electron transfer flavoprotein subunit alpha [Pelagibacterales bacterium]PPR27399.1 MAG: Electron transfer flavoprotein subunit alpha [Alphaproteobacteria bacterium MarineAlpha9_Bin4]|tara:strand:+ start:1767 stop:2690 length:924 start_codon:yes stop_codon:yes gene_type:complete
MRCLLILELENGKPSRSSLATVTASKKLAEDIDILILDTEVNDDVLNSIDAENVYHFSASPKNLLAEEIVKILETLSIKYDFILSPSGTFSKNFMPRLAANLDKQMISDVTNIHDKNTFDRPIYAGNAIATIRSDEKIKLITIRSTAFEPYSNENSNKNAKLISLNLPEEAKFNKFVSKEESKSERPELSSARIVVSGGRGIGSTENFKIVESLADKLGAAVGASRAAVDAGYISNDYQVGQTGKVVAPELYIAIGISGAIQHLAGMKDSKVIVAINKDEDAPIFQVADYGLVGDLFSTIPEITKLI